jgi:hypothetical protein
MGGVSEGKLKITDAKTLDFFGNLSLKNNGGFASVRTKAKVTEQLTSRRVSRLAVRNGYAVGSARKHRSFTPREKESPFPAT